MLDSEEKYIEGARGGDAESFGALYDHYLPQIYRFVFAKVSNRELAEDITHEVFMSAWQGVQRYTHKGFPFSSWLYRIARNQVIDHYRTEKHAASIDEIDSEAFHIASGAESEAERNLAWQRVRCAMEGLSNDEYDVLVLRFVNDLTPREIAEILEKSEGAVRVIQHRAITELKRKIREA